MALGGKRQITLIRRDGAVRNGTILKADSLNHQLDVKLLDELGKNFISLQISYEDSDN